MRSDVGFMKSRFSSETFQKIKDEVNKYVIEKALGMPRWEVFVEIDVCYNLSFHETIFFIFDRRLGKNISLVKINEFITTG